MRIPEPCPWWGWGAGRRPLLGPLPHSVGCPCNTACGRCDNSKATAPSAPRTSHQEMLLTSRARQDLLRGHGRGSRRHGVCTRVCSPGHMCFQIVFCHGVRVSHADCSRGFARPALRVTPGLGSGSGCLGDRAPLWAHGVSTRTSPCLAPLPQAQGALFQPRSPSPGLRGSLGGALKVTHHLELPALWMGIVTPDSWRPQPQGASATHLEHGLRSWPGWLRAGSGGEGGLPDSGVEGIPWMWTQGLGPLVPPSLPCSLGWH